MLSTFFTLDGKGLKKGKSREEKEVRKSYLSNANAIEFLWKGRLKP